MAPCPYARPCRLAHRPDYAYVLPQHLSLFFLPLHSTFVCSFMCMCITRTTPNNYGVFLVSRRRCVLLERNALHPNIRMIRACGTSTFGVHTTTRPGAPVWLASSRKKFYSIKDFQQRRQQHAVAQSILLHAARKPSLFNHAPKIYLPCTILRETLHRSAILHGAIAPLQKPFDRSKPCQSQLISRAF